MNALAEPWLRGPITAVHPISIPFLHAMTQVREDLFRWACTLSTKDIWARPFGIAPVGFHIRHIGGSTERLATYLKRAQLSAEQLAELAAEMEPGASGDELFAKMEEQLLYAEALVKALDPRSWHDARTVGRNALPSTVGGLVTHMAEHAQRHTGEAIVTVKVVLAVGLGL